MAWRSSYLYLDQEGQFLDLIKDLQKDILHVSFMGEGDCWVRDCLVDSILKKTLPGMDHLMAPTKLRANHFVPYLSWFFLQMIRPMTGSRL